MLQACSTVCDLPLPIRKEFDVAYLKNHESAVLRVDNQEYTLIRSHLVLVQNMFQGDGKKPILNPLVLHTKGEHARLEVGSEVYKGCRI